MSPHACLIIAVRHLALEMGMVQLNVASWYLHSPDSILMHADNTPKLSLIDYDVMQCNSMSLLNCCSYSTCQTTESYRQGREPCDCVVMASSTCPWSKWWHNYIQDTIHQPIWGYSDNQCEGRGEWKPQSWVELHHSWGSKRCEVHSWSGCCYWGRDRGLCSDGSDNHFHSR